MWRFAKPPPNKWGVLEDFSFWALVIFFKLVSCEGYLDTQNKKRISSKSWKYPKMSTLKQVKLEIPFAKLRKLLILNKKSENTCFEQQIEHLLASQHWHFKNHLCWKLGFTKGIWLQNHQNTQDSLILCAFPRCVFAFFKKTFSKANIFFQNFVSAVRCKFSKRWKKCTPKFAKCKVF